MKYKKTIIFLSIIIIAFLSIVILGYEKPRIWITNFEKITHDNVEAPFDLTVIVNGDVVFKDSLNALTLSQAIIEVEFKWGVNKIIAYSNKANLYSEWTGLHHINNRILIQISRLRYEEVDKTRLRVFRN